MVCVWPTKRRKKEKGKNISLHIITIESSRYGVNTGLERSIARSESQSRESGERIIAFFKSSFSRNLFPSKMTVFQINMFAKVCVALWALVKRILKWVGE